jgi:ribosomal protein S21
LIKQFLTYFISIKKRQDEDQNKQNLEKALKVLKGKVIKTKQTEKLREKLKYEKKSVLKRNQKLKAKYVQSQKNKDNL